MERLIDANKLWLAMESDQTVDQYCYPCAERIGKAIKEQPTIDAVHVVRCKDCKHRPIGGEAYNHTLIFPDEYCPCNCVDDNWYSWMPDDNWFCGNGERKDNV
jgi:hypothetical protein